MAIGRVYDPATKSHFAVHRFLFHIKWQVTNRDGLGGSAELRGANVPSGKQFEEVHRELQLAGGKNQH